MGAVVSCFSAILESIGVCLMSIVHGIGSIFQAIIAGIVSLFAIIISCLTCGHTGRRRTRPMATTSAV
ncbi:hypothetical protein V1517DRAFT_87707 [Lipomyces orientalis]|uniref:Uncharacterized protein n=1 Tax=Lipomyces orientalis TaxID=1233043 RepID=A0ACC3TUI5_9ASCO